MNKPKMAVSGKWKLQCPHCFRIITGTSEKHCLSNHKIHIQFCKSRKVIKDE